MGEIEYESLKQILAEILEQQKLIADRVDRLGKKINAWGSPFRDLGLRIKQSYSSSEEEAMPEEI